MKNVLICVDRDGTLIYDDKYYLGRTHDWKSQITFLKGVIDGIKNVTKKLPNCKLYMITNNPGIAIKDFTLLTSERNKEVNVEVLRRLSKEGAGIRGFFASPYISKEYVKKHPQYTFDKEYIKDSVMTKPQPGMVYESIKAEGFNKKTTKIYVIGDRLSDVECGLNAKGVGILIPFVNHPDELKKVEEFKAKTKNKNIYIAKDFSDAIEFIIDRES